MFSVANDLISWSNFLARSKLIGAAMDASSAPNAKASDTESVPRTRRFCIWLRNSPSSMLNSLGIDSLISSCLRLLTAEISTMHCVPPMPKATPRPKPVMLFIFKTPQTNQNMVSCLRYSGFFLAKRFSAFAVTILPVGVLIRYPSCMRYGS